LPPLREPTAVVLELHANLVCTGWNRLSCFYVEQLDPEEVVTVFEFAVLGVQAPAIEAAPLGNVTPSAPDLGTTTSAVTEYDLFLMATTEPSLKPHTAKENL
jgi:hypothetical protein